MASQTISSKRHWPSRFTLTFFVNVVLHCVQVACLAILVARNRQHKALASWSGGMISNLLALKFNLLPSAIFKIYNILLAFLTQSLALEREARVEQTLTDIHDKTSAWKGELEAILALIQQNWFRSGTFWRIWFISLYLFCVTVLCTAASSIVTYVWRPGDQTYLNITYLLPNITTDHVKDGYPALSILPVMDRIGVAGALGLWNNIVFDPPYPQDGIVDRVSAVRFNVNCQALSNAHQSGPVKVNTSTSGITFPFHVDDTLQDVEFSLANRMINIVGADRSNNAKNQSLPPTLLLGSTIPITDEINGTTKSISALAPPLAFSSCDTQNCLSQSQVQILACDMWTTFLNISVSGSSGVPANRRELLRLNNTWSKWTGPPVPQDPLQTTLGAFTRLSPVSNTRYGIALVNSSAKGTYMQTLLEESVMGDLGVEDGEDSLPSLGLSNVNLALGRALALVYWRASLTSSSMGLTSTQPPPDSPDSGGYEILVNSYMPFISLIVSVLALILTMILTWPAKEPSIERLPTNLGVLQMFWRAGVKDAEVAKTLHSDVKNPTTYNLRLEGHQYKMRVDGSIVRRTHAEADSNTSQPEMDDKEGKASTGAKVFRPDMYERSATGAWQSTTTAGDSSHVRENASESTA